MWIWDWFCDILSQFGTPTLWEDEWPGSELRGVDDRLAKQEREDSVPWTRQCGKNGVCVLAMWGGVEASGVVTDCMCTTWAIVDATSHAQERSSGNSPAYSSPQYVLPTAYVLGD
jgi:hypothetical protein